MQIKHYLIILTAIPILLASSCKKEPPENYSFKLQQAFLDYAYFKTGSYWIYKDSVTGQLDTHTVVFNEIRNLEKRENSTGQINFEEIFRLDISRSFINDVVVVHGKDCFENEEHKPNLHCGRVDMAGSLGNVDICRYLPVLGVRTTSGEVVKYYNTLQVNTVDYTDVQVLYTSSNKVDGGFRSYIYFSGGVGIVKKRIYTRPTTGPHYWRVWELTNHNIIQ